MILIGQFDSPFVRRVAVSLNWLAIPFEHRPWSVGRDFDLIRRFNPLGRVPALVLADGETLIESGVILDYLDELVGPERALLPPAGAWRREALHLMALAVGAADKGVQQIVEVVFRPEEKRHAPWLDRCRTQMQAALGVLEQLALARAGAWLVADRVTQADITVGCVVRFLSEAHGVNRESTEYPALANLSARCEALPAFLATPFDAYSAPVPSG
jgi:glutathione S-transferase